MLAKSIYLVPLTQCCVMLIKYIELEELNSYSAHHNAFSAKNAAISSIINIISAIFQIALSILEMESDRKIHEMIRYLRYYRFVQM